MSSSLEQAAGSGSAGLCANATFNLLRNRQTGLQRGRPITHPHRQRVGVPILRGLASTRYPLSCGF